MRAGGAFCLPPGNQPPSVRPFAWLVGGTRVAAMRSIGARVPSEAIRDVPLPDGSRRGRRQLAGSLLSRLERTRPADARRRNSTERERLRSKSCAGLIEYRRRETAQTQRASRRPALVERPISDNLPASME